MLTLCIDTAYKYLTCVLIKDNTILSSFSRECFKRQSEEVFMALDIIFDKARIDRDAIDSICISKGPGSYTGIRIAMTIAKVIGEIKPCNVFTISTLRLYAANQKNTMVLMNARAQRAYCGIFDGEKIIMNDCVRPLNEIDAGTYNVMGDGELVGRDNNFGDIPAAFLKTRMLWERVDKIPYLVPEYLKESETYLQ